MKSQLQAVLSLALAACAVAAPVESRTSAGTAALACTYPIGTHGFDFARPVGRLFEIDGKVQYFAGTNAWWLAHLNSNADVDIAIKEMVATGYKIVRVWGFGDTNTVPATNAPFGTYFHVLNSTGAYINYGTDGLQRLDYVVSAAEKAGLKLVLNFVNNWGDMGGIGAYTAAFGGNSTSWFTDSTSQHWYQSYITAVVNRYKASSAIFAWELANEPRCHGCDTSVIYNWASTTSRMIKMLDPFHMVTLGDEGWFAPADNIGDGSYGYGGAEGVDFAKNLEIPTLDYGVFHLYPNSWGYNYTWGSEWIAQHDAVGAKQGKPVVLEEYGTPFPDDHILTEAPWQAEVLASGLAADQIWQFGTNDMSVSLASISDVNTIVYGDSEYATLGTQHCAAMSAKSIWSADHA